MYEVLIVFSRSLDCLSSMVADGETKPALLPSQCHEVRMIHRDFGDVTLVLYSQLHTHLYNVVTVGSKRFLQLDGCF